MLKRGDFFFFPAQVRQVPPRGNWTLLSQSRTWVSPEAAPPTRPLSLSASSRAGPGAAGSDFSRGRSKYQMCCSLVDRRWHSAFIFTCARVDIYSLRVGKGQACQLSWQQTASLASTGVFTFRYSHSRRTLPEPERSGSPGAPAIFGHGPTLAWGSRSFPCLPEGATDGLGWRITAVFWNRSLPKLLKRFIIYRQRDENMKYVRGGPWGEGQLLPGSNFSLKFL